MTSEFFAAVPEIGPNVFRAEGVSTTGAIAAMAVVFDQVPPMLESYGRLLGTLAESRLMDPAERWRSAARAATSGAATLEPMLRTIERLPVETYPLPDQQAVIEATVALCRARAVLLRYAQFAGKAVS